MKNQIDYSGFIDKYLNKTMQKEELRWFRSEMEINPSLAEEVQFQKDIGKAILNQETLDFRAQITSLFEKEKEGKPVVQPKRLHMPHAVRVAVASLAALIMMGAGIYLYTHRSIPADQLFEAYYEPYDGLMNVRSSSAQFTDVLVTAMQKYENREFESALLLFETVLASDRENITSRFYSGISYMETERFNIAEKSFSGVIDHDNNLFIEHAEWYLGLCYLKTGQKDKAENLLALIADSEGYYSKKARRLARNL